MEDFVVPAAMLAAESEPDRPPCCLLILVVQARNLPPAKKQEVTFTLGEERCTTSLVTPEVLELDANAGGTLHFGAEVDLQSLSDRQPHRQWHRLEEGEVELILRWMYSAAHAVEVPLGFEIAESHLEEPPNTLWIYLLRGRNMSKDARVRLELKGQGTRPVLSEKWEESFVMEAEEGALEINGSCLVDLQRELGDRKPHRRWYDCGYGKVEIALRWVHDPESVVPLPPVMLEEHDDMLPRNALQIALIRGRGLSPPVFDPSVSFEVMGERVTSTKKHDTLAPVWLESFEVALEEEARMTVCLEGRVSVDVDLLSLLKDSRRALRKWILLDDVGKLELGLRWYHDPRRHYRLPKALTRPAACEKHNILRVYLIRARMKSQVAFALLTIEGDGEKPLVAKRTKKKNVWLQSFEFRVSDAPGSRPRLRLEIRSDDAVLGSLTVDLNAELPDSKTKRKWFDLTEEGKVELGLRWGGGQEGEEQHPTRFTLPPPAVPAADEAGGANTAQVVLLRATGLVGEDGYGPKPTQLRLSVVDDGTTTEMGHAVLPLSSSEGREWLPLTTNGFVEVAWRLIHVPRLVVPDDFAQPEIYPLEPPNVLRVYLLRGRGFDDGPKSAKFWTNSTVLTSTPQEASWGELFELDCHDEETPLNIAVDDCKLVLPPVRETRQAWHSLEGTELELAVRWVHDPARAKKIELPADIFREQAVEQGGAAAEGESTLAGAPSAAAALGGDLAKLEAGGAAAEGDLGCVVGLTLIEASLLLPNTLKVCLVRGYGHTQRLKGSFEIGGEVREFHVEPPLRRGGVVDLLECFEMPAEDGELTVRLDEHEVVVIKDGWHRFGDALLEIALKWVHDPTLVVKLPAPFRAENFEGKKNALHVCVLRCRGLDKQDLSVAVRFRGLPGRDFTETEKKTVVNPVWRESGCFRAEEAGSSVEIIIYGTTITDSIRDEANIVARSKLCLASLDDGETRREWHCDGKVEVALRWSHEPEFDVPTPGLLLESSSKGPLNLLQCFVARCADVRAPDAGSLYVRLWLRDACRGSKETSRIAVSETTGRRLASSPVFNETLELPVEETTDSLEIAVMSNGEELGRCSLDLDLLQDGALDRRWLKMKNSKIDIALRWRHDPALVLQVPRDVPSADPAFQYPPNALILAVCRCSLVTPDPALRQLTLRMGGQKVLSFAEEDSKYSKVGERHMLPLQEDDTLLRLELLLSSSGTLIGSTTVPLSSYEDRKLRREWITLDSGDRVDLAVILLHQEAVRFKQVVVQEEVLDEEPSAETRLDYLEVPKFYAELKKLPKPAASTMDPKKQPKPPMLPVIPPKQLRLQPQVKKTKKKKGKILPTLLVDMSLMLQKHGEFLIDEDDRPVSPNQDRWTPLPKVGSPQRRPSVPMVAVEEDEASVTNSSRTTQTKDEVSYSSWTTATTFRKEDDSAIMRKRLDKFSVSYLTKSDFYRKDGSIRNQWSGPLKEQQGDEASFGSPLASRLESARSESRAGNVRVALELEAAQRRRLQIPVDFLAKERRQEAALDIGGLRRLNRLGLRLGTLKSKRAFLRRWVSRVDELNQKRRAAASCKIQNAARQFFLSWRHRPDFHHSAGLAERARSRDELIIRDELNARLQSVLSASQCIHRTLLRFAVRRRMRRSRELARHATNMARCYHRRGTPPAQSQVLSFFGARGKKAACAVETRWRGYIARVRYSVMRERQVHRGIKVRYATVGSSVSYNFEQQGAAHLVQRWFNELPYRVFIKERRATNNAALLIKRNVRNRKFVALLKERVRATRQRRLVDLKRRRAAVSLLGRWARGRLARQRFLATVEEARLAEKSRLAEEQDAKARAKLRLFQMKHPLHARKLTRGMLILQTRMRGHLARRHLVDLRWNRLARMRLLVACYVQGFYRRLRRWRAAKVLTSRLRLVNLRAKQRATAALRIQTTQRLFFQNRFYLKKREAMRLVALVLQPLARKYVASLAFLTLLREARRFAETRKAGKADFERSRTKELQRQTMTQSAVLRPDHACDLQRLFQHYSAFGQRGNTTRLGVSNFTRLFKKDAKVKIKNADLELFFMKSRSGKESHLYYADFHKAARLVAEHVFKKKKPFVALLQRHLFTVPAMAEIRQKLKGCTLQRRADNHISKAALRIAVLYCGRRRRRTTRVSVSKNRDRQKAVARSKAAKKIQNFIRGVIAREKTTRLATRVYERFIEKQQQHGKKKKKKKTKIVGYWYNPRTRRAVWTKPSLLGWRDVLDATLMPDPEEAYSVRCAHCAGQRSVSTYCLDCEELYCEVCDLSSRRHIEVSHHRAAASSSHRRNKPKKPPHEALRVESCVQCGFQVGTRLCDQCEDFYCDTCYRNQHNRGNLKHHSYVGVVPFCDDCGDRAARRTGGPLIGTLKLCIPCTKSRYEYYSGEVPALIDSMPEGMREVLFEPSGLKAHREKLKEEARREKILAAEAGRLALIRAGKETEYAIKIQRVYRGFRKRKELACFLEERREWLALRKLDADFRASWLYQLQCFLGTAPLLPSDTDLETVQKRTAYWARGLVSDVVDGRWTEFAEHVKEQDNFLKTHGSPKLLDRAKLKARRALKVAERRSLELSTVKPAQFKYKKAQEEYRVARSANAVKSELELKRTAMRRARKMWELEKKSLVNIDEELAALDRERRLVMGPDMFQRRISTAKKLGDEVPGLRLALAHGSELANPIHDGVDLTKAELIALLKVGKRFRIVLDDEAQGDFEMYPEVYQSLRNDGNPTELDKLKLKLKRAMMATYLRLANAQKEIMGEEEQQGDEEALDWRERQKEEDAAFQAKLPTWNRDDPGLIRQLRLNRRWGYGDQSDLRVYRLPRLIALDRLALKSRRMVQSSPALQIPVKLALTSRASLSLLMTNIAQKVDEGSAEEAKWRRRALRQRSAVEYWQSRLLTSKFDPFVTGFGVVSTSRTAFKVTKIAAALPLLLGQKVALSAAQIMHDSRDPCVRWEKKAEKRLILLKEIIVSTTGVSPDPRTFASVEIHEQCPAHLAREILKRMCFRDLNQAGIGAHFDYMLQGEPLPRDTERSTTLIQLAPERFDSATRETQHVLFLRKSSSPFEAIKQHRRDQRRESRALKMAKSKQKSNNGLGGSSSSSSLNDDADLWSDDEEEEKKDDAEEDDDASLGEEASVDTILTDSQAP